MFIVHESITALDKVKAQILYINKTKKIVLQYLNLFKSKWRLMLVLNHNNSSLLCMAGKSTFHKKKIINVVDVPMYVVHVEDQMVFCS